MMADVDVVTATSPSCCSCSAASSETSDECCSLSTLFSFCRRKHRAGSETSLIKSDLASTSSSVAASKRTLTSQDCLLPVSPAPSTDPPVDVRSPPSCLGVSRSVGGYSTFTSCTADETGSCSDADGDRARTSENVPPRGGQQCRVLLVDDVIADVRTLINGDVNGGSSYQPGSCVAGDAPDGPDADSTNIKDGGYFLSLVDSEQNRLQQLCCRTERHLQEPDGTVPEEVQGKMRAAIGKAHLLTTKKFRQFRQLCNENLSKQKEDPFQTTDADLAGFWDMVLLQVADVDRMFSELDELKRHDWNSHSLAESTSRMIDVSPRSLSGRRGRTTPRTGRPSHTPPTARSTKSDLSSRSRQEARQRLAAAKLAGRQRKASDSDNDVEIFVS